MACLSPDESPPPDWPELLGTEDLYVPAIWPTEIVNGLLMARRRKRLTQNELNRSLLAACSGAAFGGDRAGLCSQ